MKYVRFTLLLPLVAFGCKSAPPPPSGFLSDYSRLEDVSSSTLRWIDEETS